MLKTMFWGTVLFSASWREPKREGEAGRASAPALIERFAGASCVISIFGSSQGDFSAFKERAFAGLHRLTAAL